MAGRWGRGRGRGGGAKSYAPQVPFQHFPEVIIFIFVSLSSTPLLLAFSLFSAPKSLVKVMLDSIIHVKTKSYEMACIILSLDDPPLRERDKHTLIIHKILFCLCLKNKAPYYKTCRPHTYLLSRCNQLLTAYCSFLSI